ncbi:hypothetical protein ACTFIR_011360 [Dictyostelium discoideum]
MRKYSIISLLVFMAVFALITVSYVKPWSYINEPSANGPLEWHPYVEWYPLKARFFGEMTVKYTEFGSYYDPKINLKYFIQFCNASLALAIFAWIGSIVMIIISIADIMEKKIPKICKFLGWIVFLFSLLSFSIYLASPSAKIKDCRKSFFGTRDCNTLPIFQQRLIGTYIEYSPKYREEVEYKFGLSAGLICIVIACAVSLFGSIYNLFFFNHQNV